MAEPFSVERRKLMRMLGAKVIVTPKAGKGTGMVEKAAELAEHHGWFLCHQFGKSLLLLFIICCCCTLFCVCVCVCIINELTNTVSSHSLSLSRN